MRYLQIKNNDLLKTIEKTRFKVVALLVLMVPYSILAYEPVVSLTKVFDQTVTTISDSSPGTCSQTLGTKFAGFVPDQGLAILDHKFYLSRDDCVPYSGPMDQRFMLTKIAIHSSILLPADDMGITSIAFYFNPGRGGRFSMDVTSKVKAYKPGPEPAPGVDPTKTSKTYTYKMQLMDSFDSFQDASYSTLANKPLLKAQFCGTNSPKELRYDVYHDANNTYLVVRTPQNPAGLVVSAPVRVGYGKSIEAGLVTASSQLQVLTCYASVDARYKPLDQKPDRIFSNFAQFYFRFDKHNPAATRNNLTDDINLFYGAKNYPVRSPLLDRTNGAAAVITSVIN